MKGTACTLDWRNADEKYVLYILAVSFLAYILPYALIFVSLTKARNSQTVEKTSCFRKTPVLPGELSESQLINVRFTLPQNVYSCISLIIKIMICGPCKINARCNFGGHNRSMKSCYSNYLFKVIKLITPTLNRVLLC